MLANLAQRRQYWLQTLQSYCAGSLATSQGPCSAISLWSLLYHDHAVGCSSCWVHREQWHLPLSRNTMYQCRQNFPQFWSENQARNFGCAPFPSWRLLAQQVRRLPLPRLRWQLQQVSIQAAITNGMSLTARGVSGGCWVCGLLGMLQSVLCKPSVEHHQVDWEAQLVYLASWPRFLRDFLGWELMLLGQRIRKLAFKPEFEYAMPLRSVFETVLFWMVTLFAARAEISLLLQGLT